MLRYTRRGVATLFVALFIALSASQSAYAGRLGLLSPPPDCGTKTIVVVVCHPCTGCELPVELCVPCCCDDHPLVRERCTLIGAGLVRYDWCCGFTAVIRFDRCGGYKVSYRG